MNLKSDVNAKQAFCGELRRRGYSDVKVSAAPADVSAVLNGETYLFEIKYTRATRHYFGAATLTEWLAAMRNMERFRFVIAWQDAEEWQFKEYTFEEFMTYSRLSKSTLTFQCARPFVVHPEHLGAFI